MAVIVDDIVGAIMQAINLRKQKKLEDRKHSLNMRNIDLREKYLTGQLNDQMALQRERLITNMQQYENSRDTYQTNAYASGIANVHEEAKGVYDFNRREFNRTRNMQLIGNRGLNKKSRQEINEEYIRGDLEEIRHKEALLGNEAAQASNIIGGVAGAVGSAANIATKFFKK